MFACTINKICCHCSSVVFALFQTRPHQHQRRRPPKLVHGNWCEHARQTMATFYKNTYTFPHSHGFLYVNIWTCNELCEMRREQFCRTMNPVFLTCWQIMLTILRVVRFWQNRIQFYVCVCVVKVLRCPRWCCPVKVCCWWKRTWNIRSSLSLFVSLSRHI